MFDIHILKKVLKDALIFGRNTPKPNSFTNIFMWVMQPRLKFVIYKQFYRQFIVLLLHEEQKPDFEQSKIKWEIWSYLDSI